MLDELLGRAALREEIEELEEEVERLEAQLASAEEQRKAAVRDRQEADERINRLEDRIADLEGQVENAQSGEWSPRYRGQTDVSRRRIRDLVERLRGFEYGEEEAYTAMVKDTVPEVVRERFGAHSALVDRAKPCLVLTDSFGIVSVALRPPRPPSQFEGWADSFRLEEEWFVPQGSFGFALVRADLFAYGEYEDESQVYSTSFESDVRSQHSKGGYSQARFERRRDEQIENHLTKARNTIRERDPEELVVVGDPSVINSFTELAGVVRSVDATSTTDEPLEAAFESFWTTTVYQL